MRERQAQYGDVAQNTRNRDKQLHQENIDTVSVHPRLPDLDPWRTLECSGEHACDIPARGKPTEHICPRSNRLDWENPEVEEQERYFVGVDPCQVDDLCSDNSLPSRQLSVSR